MSWSIPARVICACDVPARSGVVNQRLGEGDRDIRASARRCTGTVSAVIGWLVDRLPRRLWTLGNAHGQCSFDPGWADTADDEGHHDIAGRRFACPCCGYLTLPVRGDYELCDVCFWEDGGHDDDDDPNGPNHISLNEARISFAALGACDRGCLDRVRPPRPEEIPPEM